MPLYREKATAEEVANGSQEKALHSVTHACYTLELPGGDLKKELPC